MRRSRNKNQKGHISWGAAEITTKKGTYHEAQPSVLLMFFPRFDVLSDLFQNRRMPHSDMKSFCFIW